ncbi:MAG TPA: hypothetical protein RMH99_12350 [Sandaracinaceae bacterium LLY-WYZ-13_1]|nr:hypothetical protein [Sandaracinaceae bacterium LLY-WYZ-13_1]
MPLALLALAVLGGAATAAAQLPSGPEEIAWTSFVGGPGRSSERQTLPGEPGTIDLGDDTAWRCGFGRARHAAISAEAWSVQRVLACRREGSTVSATASCRVHDGRLQEHAATLSLGSVADRRHVTVTLSCRAR